VKAGYFQGERLGDWFFEQALLPAKLQPGDGRFGASEKRNPEAAEHKNISKPTPRQ
jgi:hypothetical protein